ncbi:protein SUPPRESSOR OF K(+) TRANSPORT GROWTH DEFECT 1-like isoform X7 [Fagus crenata]
MYNNFKKHAMEYVKQAVQEDDARNYSKYFRTHLKYEKNPKIKEAITLKFMEYLRRAEEIKAILDNGGSGPGVSGDAAIASQQKTKWKGGEGKDAEDPEQAKLRAGLDSMIIREKPNVKCSDVAGLESAKQALQEAIILHLKFPYHLPRATSPSATSNRTTTLPIPASPAAPPPRAPAHLL